MVYKTLHWYILRDLLRIFLLTAAALTTLLAFGGMFKPFTKQGVDLGQLLEILMNLMPAMLAYAIPIAALFAAVLVYWRLATDNEVTACRAGGISFLSLVIPALLLGAAVAAVDWGFVNYVVPHFLQNTEQALRRDMGRLLVNQIGRQEKFQYQNLVVYADAAHEEPSHEPHTSTVRLDGMAAAWLDHGQPSTIILARQALVTLTDFPKKGSTEISGQLTDAAAYNPNTFQKMSGSVNALTPDGKPLVIPSLLKSKPKFLDRTGLLQLLKDPTPFPDVAAPMSKMQALYQFQEIAEGLYHRWQDAAPGPLVLRQDNAGAARPMQFSIFAAAVAAPPANGQLTLLGAPGKPLRVEQRLITRGAPGILQNTYTAGAADIVISHGAYTGESTTTSIELRGNVMTQDNVRGIAARPAGSLVVLPPVALPPDLARLKAPDNQLELLADARASSSSQLRALAHDAGVEVTKLIHTIRSEFNSRGSFSLSCLTLVLLGAALGIELRGRNPLAVFVVGFVPAVLLVLLITAGRELAEGASKHVAWGIALIWSGNIVLLVLVTAVYARLVRR